MPAFHKFSDISFPTPGAVRKFFIAEIFDINMVFSLKVFSGPGRNRTYSLNHVKVASYQFPNLFKLFWSSFSLEKVV